MQPTVAATEWNQLIVHPSWKLYYAHVLYTSDTLPIGVRFACASYIESWLECDLSALPPLQQAVLFFNNLLISIESEKQSFEVNSAIRKDLEAGKTSFRTLLWSNIDPVPLYKHIKYIRRVEGMFLKFGAVKPAVRANFDSEAIRMHDHMALMMRQVLINRVVCIQNW